MYRILASISSFVLKVFFCNFSPFNTRRRKQRQLRRDTPWFLSHMLVQLIAMYQSSVFKLHITFGKTEKSFVCARIRTQDLWIQKRGTELPDHRDDKRLEGMSNIIISRFGSFDNRPVPTTYYFQDPHWMELFG